MKSGLLLAGLAPIALAEVHHAHQHLHKKEVDYVTKIDYVTAPAAVVYVNQEGVPVSTSFPNGAAPTGAAQQTSSVVVPAASSGPAADSSPVGAESSAAKPAPVSSSASTGSTKSTGSTGSTGSSETTGSLGVGSSGLGIAYSPYNADSSCKSQSQVNQDFEMINGYSYTRLYGVDCNQVTTVGNAIKSKGMKMMVGVYDINAVQQELQTLDSAVGGDYSDVAYITIGNEVVNSGEASPAQVVAAIKQARDFLGSTSYKGPVATVDVFSSIIQYPELCEASDFAGCNIHAFFDSDITAAQAGSYVRNITNQCAQACPGKTAICTESGYPYQGSSNGAAVPSPANQLAAINSLKAEFSKDLFLFSAFDDMWKTNSAGTFGTEQYWGFVSHSTSL